MKEFEKPSELISQRVFKVGYVLKKERHFHFDEDGIVMTTAYTLNGAYIGDSKRAYYLFKKGIIPELIDNEHKVCSIGFNKSERRWYGWSHRAIYGFGIGSKVKKGDCASDYLPVGFKAKTYKEAKEMAIAFAKSVS